MNRTRLLAIIGLFAAPVAQAQVRDTTAADTTVFELPPI